MPRRSPDPSRTPAQPASARHQSKLRPGLVITCHGPVVLVEDSHGDLVRCHVRRRLGTVVSGDRVEWRPTTRGQGVIEAVAARRTVLRRYQAGARSKALAANVDLVVITVAPQPPLSRRLIDRYLVATELTGADALVLMNKSDLLDENTRAGLEDQLREYRDVGYRVHFCSALRGDGIGDLQEALRGHTGILVGQSGVGKSSLVRALLPDQKVRIGELSSATGLGRHTTTSSTLYHLEKDGDLIDSPGVRDFQLWQVAGEQLAAGFREFREYGAACRFHNCRHNGEPGCAVDAAADRGSISQRRLESYRGMLRLTGDNR